MDVRKIAKLAHLEITDEEVALYSPQMANIVKYVEQLNELDTDSVEPMIGGLTTSFALELLIYPILFYVAKRIALAREWRAGMALPAAA